MDPRIDRTRRHVLAAARRILLERGADAVTFSAVAREAHVTRNTLYRHWATPEQLLVDLTLRYYLEDQQEHGGAGPHEPATSVGDFLHAVRDNLRAPGTIEALTALAAQAERSPGSEQALRQVAELRQKALSTATGPLSDAAFARIVGPLFYQALIARRPVDDAFLAELIAATSPAAGTAAGSFASPDPPGADT
ncbi:TetR/AcrR family transcriptional regulator [Streptantibioticus ferralitis]|uniref:TetR/AcrR family transcriptional regulator n=1 Tax=Streptantibioticus ferralitis TaxID=236510 RepID=A0ABT5YX25_9ACTN|nr:TetR/AcrR family transcriptional regulator [Streptantibioticus ferralitis]MDF2255999.1 TetR/AcrR family transcriptional regulator [Streptantibioticus ferralitis]